MPIPSQAEYEARMNREAMQREREIDSQSLADRKAAQKEWFKSIRNEPALVAERLGWLIEGNYGYGEMQRAKRIIASPRMNRPAALCQLVAIYEWQCPARMAVDAWKKLTQSQKDLLESAINIVIEEAEKKE